MLRVGKVFEGFSDVGPRVDSIPSYLGLKFTSANAPRLPLLALWREIAIVIIFV
jgi:hypothetical protein